MTEPTGTITLRVEPKHPGHIAVGKQKFYAGDTFTIGADHMWLVECGQCELISSAPAESAIPPPEDIPVEPESVAEPAPAPAPLVMRDDSPEPEPQPRQRSRRK